MKQKNQKLNESKFGMSRRSFIGKTSLAAAAITIVPRHVLGGQGYTAPSDKLNIACIGIGGKGNSDSAAMAGENVVALCDVDDIRGAETRERYPNARFYEDYRVLFDKEKVDACTISTPDHTHAVIAMAAMKRGIHVYVQKPLTHTVEEARVLAKTAKENNIVSQMGNQGHAGDGARLVNEWIADDAIGDVREVHSWTNRPIWPQGDVARPEEIPSLPNYLNWNQWLGPAPYRPYHPAYHPFAWRGYWDFGTGALGDMGAHILDQPFWALDLDYPDTVHATSTDFNDEMFPLGSIVTWTFPEKDGRSPLKLVWYDGGLLPPRPAELEPGRKMGSCIYYGEDGMLMHDTYGNSPRLIPETAMREYDVPEKTIPRSPGIYEEWLEAIKNGGKSTTDFSYSSKLTETMLLGNIAIRMKEKNTILEYDGKKGEFTNIPEANELLSKEYKNGFEL